MADALKLPEPKLWTLGEAADGKVLTGIKPTAGGGVPIFTAGQVADAILAERERCAALVPTSWLDPLLTGPRAVIGRPPFNCPDIERLLHAVAAEIRTYGVNAPGEGQQ
jgi:hypothetical protein